MVLRKKISSQAKLFLPIVVLMWVFIIGTSIVMAKREQHIREEFFRNRIELINKRIINLCDKGENPSDYMSFVKKFYEETMNIEISLTVYDNQLQRILAHVGFAAPAPDDPNRSTTVQILKGAEINDITTHNTVYLPPKEKFVYNFDPSQDERFLVQTIMPLNTNVLAAFNANSWWWIICIVLCITVTIIVYITTRHLTKNIKLLSNFATNAATDKDVVTIDKFPNDDLGEISRQIVTIYNSRKAALASRELEHQIVLKATEERNLLRRQMTNNINHELKTPATIIKGYLDTLVENPDMDQASRTHFLNKARGQVDRLCSILQDLSTMTRLDEGSQKVQLDDIDFHKFVDDLSADVEESGIGQDMIFVGEVPEGCYVKANTTILSAALMNLVKNAAAYSKGAEMGIRLLTSNRRFHTFVFYDDGTGVPEEHIPHLFERFYRVDKGRSRKEGGTGLGLAIVNSSFSTLGGSISVRNGEVSGLEFVFTLPVGHNPNEP